MEGGGSMRRFLWSGIVLDTENGFLLPQCHSKLQRSVAG